MIVLINNIYFPEGSGGGEMVVKNRARAYVKKGHKVTILVTGEKYSKEFLEKNITLIRFKPVHLFLYKNAIFHSWGIRLLWHIIDTFNIGTYLQVKNILKRLQPDRVEVHNIKGIGFFIPSAIRALHIPFSMYLHDVQLAIPSGILLYGEENKFINAGFFQKIYEKTIKSLVSSPNEIISPSAWLLEYYTKKGFFVTSKKSVIKMHLTNIEIELLKTNFDILQKKINNKERIACIFVGKLEKYKGIHLLLDIWNKMPKNYFLQIYGTGSLSEDIILAKEKGSNIELIGYRPHSELLPALKKADMLIMPTLCYENRPEVILEALRNSLPVIASRIGGIPEIVIHGKIGYLFNPGDTNDMLKFFQIHK